MVTREPFTRCIVDVTVTRTLAACFAITTTLYAPRAYSQSATPGDSVARARADFERGVALYRQHDYDGALAEFVRAYELSHRATVLFNIAASYQALHRYADAIPTLHQYLDATANDASLSTQRADATRALRELEALVAHLHVRTTPPDAAVTIDGRPAREPRGDLIVGPGHHVVEASLTGHRAARAEVLVASGDVRDVDLDLSDAGADGTASREGAATLSVSGVPADASIRVDGHSHAASERVIVAPGRHAVVVAANGMRPWRGEVTLARGDARVLRVRLAVDRNALPTRFFVGGAIATGVLAIASGAAGIVTLSANAEFQTRTQESPDVQALAARGRASAIAADTLGIAAIAAAGVSIYFLARTEFSPHPSTAEIAVAPLRDGAMIGASWRF
jgi:hypothetical protein